MYFFFYNVLVIIEIFLKKKKNEKKRIKYLWYLLVLKLYLMNIIYKRMSIYYEINRII